MNQIDYAGRSDNPEPARGRPTILPGPVPVSPLIGRHAELSLLADRWEQAQEGRSQVVLVVGEPGLGKSRLIQTAARLMLEDTNSGSGMASAGNQEALVIEWRCSQHFQNSELYPVSDFMERFLHFAADQSAGERFDRLARHLESFGLDRPEDIGLFAKLLFLEPERYSATGLTPAREREKTFRMLREWLGACAAGRPALFIVEDLHWSDASTLEFLGQFINECQANRILTVFTFRPEFKVPWLEAPHQTILTLNRLTRRQVAEWMNKDSREVLPASLVTQVYQRTGGVPLLVEEFTRMIRESARESVGDGPGYLEATRPGGIPATLQELVMARLNHLASDREIAFLAATLGRQFEYELLAATASVDEPTIQAELGKLVSADILYVKGQSSGDSYLFKHALLEEALYTAIDEQKRRQFHQRIAETMELQFPKSVETQPELLAEHFARAGLIKKAVSYCLKAGLRSRDRFANVEAVSHFKKGLQLLEKLDPSPERDVGELALLAPLGTAYIAWRGYAASEVAPIFRRAHALCERVGQTPQLFATMWGNFAYHIVRGDFRICSDLAEEAIGFGERLNDPGILMEAFFLRGITRLYRGDFSGARATLAQSIADFDDRERTAFWAKAIGEDGGVTLRCYLALALWHAGFPDQALDLSREVLELARSINQPFSLEYALHHTGWLCQHCRLGSQTQVAGEEQTEIATEQGFLFWHASGTLYTAAGLLLRGQMERGLALFEKGLQAYRATGALLGLPYYLSILADACAQTGRFAEARSALSEALDIMEQNDERFQEAELYRLKGELLLAESDDQSIAEQYFRRALETADRQQSKAWRLKATTSLARLWQKQGRREEAFTALSTVYSSFTEGLTTPDLVDAATLLDNLFDERMRAEFAAGLRYVRDCIPPPFEGPISVDWRYVPASTLGGDIIGYHWLDEDHLAFYLIDVTGHGLDSALLSVTLTNVIRTGALSGVDMKRPNHVLAQLNEVFRGQQHGNKYFTIWYGVYQSANRTLTWAGGGHHPSVVLVEGEPDPILLTSEGMMMGVLRRAEFPAQSRRIPAGARLLIFSDGVFEIFQEKRQIWSLTDCIAYLAVLGKQDGNLMDALLDHVHYLRGSPHLDDDFSIIEARFQ
ncbi:MAG: SpoIIE family protein phosphatase [Verrucomicrobia bacterium]|nr:SpoIIE family protein phosphatase [Verrucomicrobiota bacterium]